MHTNLACIPCLRRQAGDAIALATSDAGLRVETMLKVVDVIAGLPMDQPPPSMAGRIHRLIREQTGAFDPYAQVKTRATAMALDLASSLRSRIEDAPDPFEAALRLAIAGNILDFAAFTSIDDKQLVQSFDEAFEKPLPEKEIEDLKAAVARARSILYLGDNAGETVFDRLFIERLPAGSVTYAVKAGPVINDATCADALAAGLQDVARILETGSDMPGTMLGECSPAFLELFEKADAVIAKGQANYETLSNAPREVFFLTQVKCATLAHELDVPLGRWIVRRHIPAAPGRKMA
jgi:hypothetical protein